MNAKVIDYKNLMPKNTKGAAEDQKDAKIDY
jgi:hypothetical protein